MQDLKEEKTVRDRVLRGMLDGERPSKCVLRRHVGKRSPSQLRVTSCQVV
jgi:hypothetical protein